MEDTYTIVLFSSLIDELSESRITDIPWYDKPSIQSGHNDGNRIASSACKAFKAFSKEEKKQLRFVCLDALEADGSISESTMIDVLQYLLDNIERFKKYESHCIDIICLPDIRMDAPDPTKLIYLIWKLRQKAIILSACPKKGINLQCCEVLAVGADIQISQGQKQLNFGADVIIKPPEENDWLPPKKSNMNAMGSVAGILAAVIEILQIKNLSYESK